MPRAKLQLLLLGLLHPPEHQTRLWQQRGPRTQQLHHDPLCSADALHHPRSCPQNALPAPELTAPDSSSTRQAQAVMFWHFTSQTDTVLSIKCSPAASAGTVLSMTLTPGSWAGPRAHSRTLSPGKAFPGTFTCQRPTLGSLAAHTPPHTPSCWHRHLHLQRHQDQ